MTTFTSAHLDLTLDTAFTALTTVALTAALAELHSVLARLEVTAQNRDYLAQTRADVVALLPVATRSNVATYLGL